MRALGIDYGERRIGLALSDATGLLASPWKTIANDANVSAAAQRLAIEVHALVAEEDGLAVVVIGLPRRLSGEANDQTARVQKFAQLLGGAVSVPIELQDERLTTVSAEAMLRDRGKKGASRRAVVDQAAAVLILQHALDTERATGRAPGEIVTGDTESGES